MLRSIRTVLARFALARAAACQRHAPRRAARWLQLGCWLSPVFAEPFPALVHLYRALEDRLAALAVAQGAVSRFSGNPDAWMLLGEASQMAFRQREALIAYEQAIAIEERPDACMAAGELYLRAGEASHAAARFARAYAAGGGAAALRANAGALFQAGDLRAADEALSLWATQVPDGLERLAGERAELRGRGA